MRAGFVMKISIPCSVRVVFTRIIRFFSVQVPFVDRDECCVFKVARAEFSVLVWLVGDCVSRIF